MKRGKSTSSRPPPRGARIGPYENALPIAIGGMAEVFRANKPQPAGADRAVVIKRMLPELVGDAEQRAMFEHEARLGARIRHPNVVEVIDHASGNSPYLVLEYVFGVDLRRLLRWSAQTETPIGTELAAYLACEMLAGLAAVHAATDERGQPLSIVHRDVSPSNVFLSVHGDVKLGDLGIAIPGAARRDPNSPPVGTRAKGKLAYLAPEQIAGLPFDARADVFAAAVVAAELFLGRPLFSAPTELGVLLAIQETDLSQLDALAKRLPPPLVAALRAALTRDPRHRTPDADTLRKALAPYAAGTPAELKRDLGRAVVGAMDSRDVKASRSSLARTVEHGAARETLEAVLLDPRRKTADTPPVEDDARRYGVEAAGKALGPWPYARVVRALRTGEIDATAEVRVDGSDARPVVLVPELARHLSMTARTPGARTPSAPFGSLPLLRGDPIDLATQSILPFLARAWVDGASGVVVCERATGAVPKPRKEIYLDHGVPTFISSNQAEELLGERLVRERVIDAAELDAALAVLPRYGGRIGDSLVALGLVSPVDIYRHIATQVRDKVLDVFAWRDGTAALYGELTAPDASFPIDLDPFSLLEQGVLHRAMVRGGEPLPPPTGVLVFVPDGPKLTLPAHAEEVLELVRVPRAFAEIVGVGVAGDRLRATVKVLSALGLVRSMR
jgi:serine/threonine-protein kinase